VNADQSRRPGEPAILARAAFSRLFDALHAQGYTIIGPRLAGGAVIYDEIANVDDLPAGWSDEQDAGHYRLNNRGGDALFGYTNGVQSWKRFLFRPQRTLWQAQRSDKGFAIKDATEETPRYAFLGMRACELRAIEIQDHVFLREGLTDPDYAARREAALFIAVNCGHAGKTCFCVSMDSGPRARTGYDLALTELIGESRHDFLVEVGSARGAALAAQLSLAPATERDVDDAEMIVSKTAASMGRELKTAGLKDLLQGNPGHPQWDDVAARCLSCANCTFVCPTCFCHTEEDVTDLDGLRAERRQRWDSCFTMDFSHLTGGSVRPDVRARYRQWLTHKLANWIDQFGESGCVGCGRCITWCPAGIDITAEVANIRATGEEA
jgi:ferredoxin